MMKNRFLLGLIPCLILCAADTKAADKPSKKPVSYYSQIRPIFQAKCHGCHQPAKDKGDYIMTTFDGLLAAGESEEKAIVPKAPEKSNLFSLIIANKEGEIEMPKGKDAKPLHELEVSLVRQWIAEGAKDDTPEGAKVRYDMDNPPLYTQPPVITSVDFSPDGKLLAVAGFHEVLLHKADGSGLVARLVGLSERIESVRFSPDGKLLAVTGGQPARMGEVQVWDVAKHTLKLSVPVTFDTVYGASWSPDGKLISFGCGDNTLRAIDAKTGKQVLYQGAHNDWVFDTVFSVKGDYVVSVGRDRSAKLTELKTQRFMDNITSITPGALAGGLASVVRHPERDEILVGGADGTPKIYRMHRTTARKIGDDANLIRKFPKMEGRVFSVDFSADGKRIAAANSHDGTGTVAIYGIKFDSKMPGDIKKIFAKRVSQRSAEEQKKINAYQVADVGPPLKATFPVPMYAVNFRPDGKVLAAAGYDGLIRLIDTISGKVTKEFMPVKIDKTAAAARANEGTTAVLHETDPTPKNKLPKGTQITALSVQPSQIKFTRISDYTQLLVTAKLSNGEEIDATRLATYETKKEVATITPGGMLRPQGDGKAMLKVSLAGHSTSLPLEVAGVEKELLVDFTRDVMPVLGKAGCNSGLCHGSKKGKAGFKLSLRGNDPLWDTITFTDDIASRRVNRASPHDSLMLLKASSAVPHEGKDAAPRNSMYYRIIHKWIADGANLNRETKRVASIDIFPKGPIVQLAGSRQQFRVVATYPDGTTADVTAESFIKAGVIDVAEADTTGLITALRRGESPILARYEGAYATTILTVMGDRTGFVWTEPTKNNYIDELVSGKLKRTKTLPSGLCTDTEFLRRIYLDLTGLPPTADQVRQFLADKRTSREKRDAMIDQLIGSDPFVDHWANKWSDLLQVNSKFLGGEGARAFHGWIRQQIKDNTPYDKFAYQILSAKGSNKENPAASYFKILRKPEETMENTTHLFLGVRFNCNKCHDHPFERWSHTQYYETAAYFARLGLKKDPAISKAAKAAAAQLATAKTATTKATAGKTAATKALTAAKAAQAAAQKAFDTSDKSATTAKDVLNKALAATKAAETKVASATKTETATKAKQAAAKKKNDQLARIDKATVGGTAVEGKKPLYEEVYDKKDGEVKHVATGKVTPPKFPFKAKYVAPEKSTRREHLAHWITTRDNRYFSKSFVNRMWGYLIGTGIIEPLDDIRAGNPPTNPELLEKLTQKFIASSFNTQEVIRDICKSRTYQLSIVASKWNEDDKINYSHAMPRRLQAEVLYDSIFQVTGAQTKLPGVPAGTRAAQLHDSRIKEGNGFLTKFGRPPRESPCECERAGGMQFGPVMALVTGPTVNTALSDPKNAIARLIKEKKDDRALIDELYLRILSRHATEQEIATSLKLLASIGPEHKALLAEKAAYEAKLKPLTQQHEKKRQAEISKAKTALETFKKSIAAREAESDKKQKATITAADKALKDHEKSTEVRFAQWTQKDGAKTPWTTLESKELKSKIGTKLSKEKSGVIFASGKNGKDTFTITAETTLKNLTGLRLEALTDKRLPKNGPGRAPGDGNFVLSELELLWAPKDKPKEQKKLKLANAKADFSQGNYAVATAIDGKLAPTSNGWAVAPQLGKPHTASFEIAQAPKHEGPILLTFVMKQEFSGKNWQLGKFRWSITDSKKPVNFGLPKNINDLLAIAPEKWNGKQKKTLLDYFKGQDSQLKKLQTTLANAKKPRPLDPKLKSLQDAIARASKPLLEDPQLTAYKRAVDFSTKQQGDKRLYGAQDIAWALINTPSFLFNR